MSSVHFIGGEKGGVGKSLMSRLLAQYFIHTETSFTGFDSDQSHGTFSRFYRDYTAPLVMNDYSSLDNILDVAERVPEGDIIIDLAAQTSAFLGQWIEESDVLSIFEEFGYTTYFWHVMDDGADSVSLLDKLLESYPQKDIHFVVVQNSGRGDSFELFEQSATYRKAKERQASFMTLGKLETNLCQKIDFSNLSFWAAANNRQLMKVVERRRVEVWLKNNYSQLDRLLGKSSPAELE